MRLFLEVVLQMAITIWGSMRYIMIVHRKSLFLCKASGEETGLAEYRRRRQALLHKESRGLYYADYSSAGSPALLVRQMSVRSNK